MKITVIGHNLSSNAVMRAHRLAEAARTFAEVSLIGPVERRGLWPALPSEPWIRTVREKRFPEFCECVRLMIWQVLNSRESALRST